MGGINLQLFNIVIVQHYSNDSWFEVVALDIIYVPFVTWIQELVGHCSNFGNLGALYHPHFPCACLASMGILAMAVYVVKFRKLLTARFCSLNSYFIAASIVCTVMVVVLVAARTCEHCKYIANIYTMPSFLV